MDYRRETFVRRRASFLPLEQKKILRAARMAIGILDEPFGAQFEQDAVEPWQQRVLSELRLDGYNADLEVYLGGESTRGKLPVRYHAMSSS